MKIADMAEARVLDIVEKCTDVSNETLVAQTADVLKEKNLQLHAARVQRNKDAGGSKKDAPPFTWRSHRTEVPCKETDRRAPHVLIGLI